MINSKSSDFVWKDSVIHGNDDTIFFNILRHEADGWWIISPTSNGSAGPYLVAQPDDIIYQSYNYGGSGLDRDLANQVHAGVRWSHTGRDKVVVVGFEPPAEARRVTEEDIDAGLFCNKVSQNKGHLYLHPIFLRARSSYKPGSPTSMSVSKLSRKS